VPRRRRLPERVAPPPWPALRVGAGASFYDPVRDVDGKAAPLVSTRRGRGALPCLPAA
jgi:hypothetical protein